LVKKGYRTPQQLRSFQLRENTFQFQVERDQQKLRVLVTYDRQKRLIEFKGKKEEAKLKLERTKTTAEAEIKKGTAAIASAKKGVKLVKEQLQEMLEIRRKATMLAEQDGIVAYANERWFDPEDRIRAGSEIWGGRNVYYLPDMAKMQVKANVHESVVDRVKKGQPVSIRLDAFSDVKLSGVVSSVANMASSSYSSVQNYETIILIDEVPPELSIKPGMTAEVDILVGVYPDTISIPIGAITEHFGQSYVYLVNRFGGEAERRIVKTGRVTHAFVEITQGVGVGDLVALDAYQRGKQDFADKERAAETSPIPKSNTSATSTPMPPAGS
jgi:multidrug efflux pump subunit AcrA (membrane-fusion protein)